MIKSFLGGLSWLQIKDIHRPKSILAIAISNEIGVELRLKEAHKYYRLAANQGNAEAQCSLGAFYYKGTGVTKNLEEAIKLLTQAGRAGVVEAQENLGLHYFKVGERLNAIAWLDLAANQGNVSSQFRSWLLLYGAWTSFRRKDC